MVRIEPLVAAAALSAPLSALHRACFPDDPWEPRAIGEVMGMTGFFGWIAWQDEEPAGFVMAQAVGEECEILALGVVAARRRAGIGRLLLEAACRSASRAGARSAVLEVAVDNNAARLFYEARGFVPVGRRRNYYRRVEGSGDALILRLAFPPASVSTQAGCVSGCSAVL